MSHSHFFVRHEVMSQTIIREKICSVNKSILKNSCRTAASSVFTSLSVDRAEKHIINSLLNKIQRALNKI